MKGVDSRSAASTTSIVEETSKVIRLSISDHHLVHPAQIIPHIRLPALISRRGHSDQISHTSNDMVQSP